MIKKALLLMNMGGATTKAELEMFLLNMFRDPNILTIRSDFFRSLLAKLIVRKRLDASWANYEWIGGSPLPRITDELVAKLTEKIGDEYLVLPVMCYIKPGNEEAIAKLVEAGITEVILFPLYPHYSTTTVKSSVESFLAAAGNHFQTTIIEPFYQDESYNQVIVERIKESLNKIAGFLPEFIPHSIAGQEWQELSTIHYPLSTITLLFSAHGLPEKIVKKWDPYQKQIEEHVEILRKMLEEKWIHFKQIKLAYQSRVGPMKWIGPSLEDTLTELKDEDVLVYPISFTIDNSETIYELHREYREIAERIGVKSYEVCDCPDTDDGFVESVVKIIRVK